MNFFMDFFSYIEHSVKNFQLLNITTNFINLKISKISSKISILFKRQLFLLNTRWLLDSFCGCGCS